MYLPEYLWTTSHIRILSSLWSSECSTRPIHTIMLIFTLHWAHSHHHSKHHTYTWCPLSNTTYLSYSYSGNIPLMCRLSALTEGLRKEDINHTRFTATSLHSVLIRNYFPWESVLWTDVGLCCYYFFEKYGGIIDLKAVAENPQHVTKGPPSAH